MKNFPTWALLLLGLTLMTSACKKENAGGGEVLPDLGAMKADINGTSWQADGAAAGLSNGVLVIGGSKSDQSGFSLAIDNPPGTGSYNFGAGNTHVATYAASAGQNGYSTAIGGSGSVSLTTYTNERAKGSFSFTAEDPFGGSITIANGTFDVRITE